jgi:hypothetical protein
MDFFQSHQTVPSRCYLLPFSRTFNCTSKTTGWFTKGAEIDPNLPHANKMYSKVAHAFLYTLMDFFQSHQTVPKRCYLTFFHIPERSIALVKRLVHQKELKLIPTCPTLTKVLSKVAHAFLYTLMDFHRNKQSPRVSTFFHIPERSIALVKRLAGSPKGAEIDPNLPHANKSVTQGSTRILIYIDGLLSVAPNCAQAVAILPSSIFPNVQLH